jgi:hypothetical protein
LDGCDWPPITNLPLAARISMVGTCLPCPRKMLQLSALRSTMVASLRLPSSCAEGSRGSPTIGRHGNVPGRSRGGVRRSCRRARLPSCVGCRSTQRPGTLKALACAGDHDTGLAGLRGPPFWRISTCQGRGSAVRLRLGARGSVEKRSGSSRHPPLQSDADTCCSAPSRAFRHGGDRSGKLHRAVFAR